MNSENESISPHGATNPASEIPTVVGFSVFLESGTRAVAGVLRRFETTRCRVLAVQTLPANSAALVKLIVTHPEEGRIILERAGLPLADYHLVGVLLPDGGQPLLRTCLPLAQANVLLRSSHLVPLPARKKIALLLDADPLQRAAEILLAHGFDLVSSETLNQESFGS